MNRRKAIAQQTKGGKIMESCCCSRTIRSREEKEALLQKIIAREEDMFIKVNEGRKKADCQTQLKTFRAMRYMSFAVLSWDTLQSYYEDLCFAVQEQRNLIVEKYARIEDLIPVINESRLIPEIVAIETAWMGELHEKYPHAIQISPQFANYERSELETYSDTTLALYHRDVQTAKNCRVNLVEERYKILYQGMGFASLAEVEAKAAAKEREAATQPADKNRQSLRLAAN